jgi:phospholipid transport system transporter-binding protein
MNATKEDLFSIQDLGAGQFALAGELSFASVKQALRQTANLLDSPNRTVFDLAEIAKADSAGLALMLEWLRQADASGVELHYAQLPGQLLAMAQVAGIDSILIID